MDLTTDDLKNLGWAIARAKEWKGSLNPEDFLEFDHRIKRCKLALRKVRQIHSSNNANMALDARDEAMSTEG